jgi:hypothetical protein
MRIRNLVILMAMTVLVCALFSVTQVVADRKTADLDGHVRGLSFSKSVPNMLNYQGYLADSADSAAVTDTLQMTFRLYNADMGGSERWSEDHTDVPVIGGLFSVLLGEVTPFPEGLFDGSTLWLQTEVGAEVLSPRKPLVSMAYSVRAQTADHAAEADHAVHADTALFSQPDEDWTISGNDIYSAVTGNVGIGDMTPSEKLDVNGNINVNGKVMYASPRTHYFVVGGEAFHPGENVDYRNSYGNGGAYMVSGAGAMVAPVHLPHGAEVIELKVFFNDNSASDMSVSLNRLSLIGGAYTILASVSSTGVSGYGSRTETSISQAIINNTAYGYLIYAYSGSWNSALKIMGALVTYTIDEAP